MKIGLYSGGLDSVLLRAWSERRGFEVRWLHFDTGFNKEDDACRARQTPGVEVRDVRARYLREVVLEPAFGYGAAMNPCLDCRIFMLKRAAEAGPHQLLTGEVVGQRGFDQSRRALALTASVAGVEGRVGRPLSDDAGLHGRSRRGQRELAASYGLRELPVPAGGCCWLARAPFARRLRDLIEHLPPEALTRDAVERLKIGRHFRLGWALKAIVARNAAECDLLRERSEGLWLGMAAVGTGATAVLEGRPDDDGFARAAALLARYGGENAAGPRDIVFRRGGDERLERAVAPSPEEIQKWRL